MTDYRSEYERYYKNINGSHSSRESTRHLFSRSKNRDFIGISYSGRNSYMSYDKRGNIAKLLIRQLEGSLILLVIFVGLKAAPSPQVQSVRENSL